MYVGFKYTSGQVHGIGTESTILGTLYNWYTANLKDYASKIDINAGFCGDRTSYIDEDGMTIGGGTDTTITYYEGYIRLNTNKLPSLSCLTEDVYTVSAANKGNKSLSYPIGLITADEVSMAGGVSGQISNVRYYLYTSQQYWTMSPSLLGSGKSAVVFNVHSTGFLDGHTVNTTLGVRPVINLRSDVTLTGAGTSTDPYIVVGGNS